MTEQASSFGIIEKYSSRTEKEITFEIVADYQRKLARLGRKHNVNVTAVEQRLVDMMSHVAKARRNMAFEAWRQKLKQGERLPRGRYFVGKKPGFAFMVIDEFAYYGKIPSVTPSNLVVNNVE